MTDMFERLLDGHRRVIRRSERLKQLLAEKQPPAMELLARIRWDLASQIMQHLSLEDRHVYGRLAAAPQADARALGERFQNQYAAHLKEYVSHSKYWTQERIQARWDDYRRRAQFLIDRMIVHIAQEEQELYPMVRRMEHSLPPSANGAHNWTHEAFAMKDIIAPR